MALTMITRQPRAPPSKPNTHLIISILGCRSPMLALLANKLRRWIVRKLWSQRIYKDRKVRPSHPRANLEKSQSEE